MRGEEETGCVDGKALLAGTSSQLLWEFIFSLLPACVEGVSIVRPCIGEYDEKNVKATDQIVRDTFTFLIFVLLYWIVLFHFVSF